MRRAAAYGTVVVFLAGCGGTQAVSPTTGPSSVAPVSLAGSGPKTTAGTARFTSQVTGVVAGVKVFAQERGTVSFTQRHAHIYRLVLGGGVPQEIVVNGPLTYTNANVEAALNDSSVKAWTRLDTRRLTAKQQGSEAQELAHVRAPAYLAYGVFGAKLIGTDPTGHTTHFRGLVDPARLAARLPATGRDAIVAAVRSDFVDRPFQADFWVDPQGRVRRVHVRYRTAGGGHLTVNATYSGFGTHVDLAVPPARDIQDITPR